MEKKIIPLDDSGIDNVFDTLSDVVDRINLDVSLLKKNITDYELYLQDVEIVLHDNYNDLKTQIDNKTENTKFIISEEVKHLKSIIDDLKNKNVNNKMINNLNIQNQKMQADISNIKDDIDRIKTYLGI